MGSKKVDIVIEVIHSVIGEMNEVIENARSLKNQMKRYRAFLQDQIGDKLFVEGESFYEDDKMEVHSFKEVPADPNSIERRSRGSSLSVHIPSNVKDELHEIHSAVERSTDLQEQFESSVTPILDNDVEEIAAAMWPQHLVRTNTESSHRISDLDSDLDSVNSSRISTSNSQRLDYHFKRNSTKKEFPIEGPSTHLPMAMVAKLKLLARQSKKSRPRKRLRSRSRTASRSKGPEEAKFEEQPIHLLSNMKLAVQRWRKRAHNKRELLNDDDASNPEFPAALPILSFVRMKRFAQKNIANRKLSAALPEQEEELTSSLPKRKSAVAYNESEALGIIGRNAKAYQDNKRPSLRRGVERLMEDVPESNMLPKIKSFIGQIPGQQETLDTERIIENQSRGAEDDEEESKKIVISCESNFVWIWDVLIFIFSIYIAVVIPIQLSICNHSTHTHGFGFETFVAIVSPIVDTMYILDILLKMRTTYLNYVKEEIWDVRLIQRKYFRSYTFKVDVCAAVPWASLVVWISVFQGPLGVLAFFRIIKVIGEQYWQKIKMSLSRSSHQNPAILRMFGIILLFFLVAHIFASMYAYNRARHNFHGTWALTEQDLLSEIATSSTAQYFQALYFSLALIAGNDKVPTTTEEHQFGILGLVVSFVVNAVIIGSATNVLSQMDTTAVAQKEQLDAVSDYLRYRRVPLKLYNKIISYYSYLWEIGQSSHSETLFQELPGKLKLELLVTLNKKLIQSVPLFKACSPAGVIMLVKRLTPCIALPYELVIKKGERADSIYFLNRGIVRCYIFDDCNVKVYLATLRDGSFFGEVALLEDNLQRTANVKAFSFCELQFLTSNDFKAVLSAFPDFQEAVAKVAKARQLMSTRLQQSQASNLLNRTGSNIQFKLQKIVNANMFIKHSMVHPIEEEEDEEKFHGADAKDDLYQAILENQRQMTRMDAEDALKNKDNINEQDFIKFERALNSKYQKQIEKFQAKKETTVKFSASAFIDLQRETEMKKRHGLINTSSSDSPDKSSSNSPGKRSLVLRKAESEKPLSPETDRRKAMAVRSKKSSVDLHRRKSSGKDESKKRLDKGRSSSSCLSGFISKNQKEDEHSLPLPKPDISSSENSTGALLLNIDSPISKQDSKELDTDREITEMLRKM